MRPTKSESGFLYHSRLFQLQVQKSKSNSQKKKRKDFIGSHTWEIRGGPGCRKVILSWLCFPLWGKPFQVSCSHPCHKVPTSVLSHITSQQKENLFPPLVPNIWCGVSLAGLCLRLWSQCTLFSWHHCCCAHPWGWALEGGVIPFKSKEYAITGRKADEFLGQQKWTAANYMEQIFYMKTEWILTFTFSPSQKARL